MLYYFILAYIILYYIILYYIIYIVLYCIIFIYTYDPLALVMAMTDGGKHPKRVPTYIMRYKPYINHI